MVCVTVGGRGGGGGGGFGGGRGGGGGGRGGPGGGGGGAGGESMLIQCIIVTDRLLVDTRTYAYAL